jgi:hypothetical protein
LIRNRANRNRWHRSYRRDHKVQIRYRNLQKQWLLHCWVRRQQELQPILRRNSCSKKLSRSGVQFGSFDRRPFPRHKRWQSLHRAQVG